MCYTTLSGQVEDLCLLPEHLRQQRASGVALAAERLAAAGLRPSAGELVPNYLRLSQAERERNKNRT